MEESLRSMKYRCLTASAVTQALDFNEYEVHPIFITLDGEWRVGPQLTEPVQTIEQLQFEPVTTSTIK